MGFKWLKPASIVIALVYLFIISCTNDKGIPLPFINKPIQGCDSSNISYSAAVQPILKNNCYSCHSTASGSGGLDLENFSSLKNYLEYFYRNDSIYGSKFSHIINQKGSVLYMPPTGKLNDCDLLIINKWIRVGAPE